MTPFDRKFAQASMGRMPGFSSAIHAIEIQSRIFYELEWSQISKDEILSIYPSTHSGPYQNQ